MTKIKIPLYWYSDLIKIPGTNNEYVLLEWFEEEECTTKTLWYLGKYLRIRQYKINQTLVDTRTIRELTLLITDNAISSNTFDKSNVNYEQIGESIQKNDWYMPYVYFVCKDYAEQKIPFFEGVDNL